MDLNKIAHDALIDGIVEALDESISSDQKEGYTSMEARVPCEYEKEVIIRLNKRFTVKHKSINKGKASIAISW